MSKVHIKKKERYGTLHAILKKEPDGSIIQYVTSSETDPLFSIGDYIEINGKIYQVRARDTFCTQDKKGHRFIVLG